MMRGPIQVLIGLGHYTLLRTCVLFEAEGTWVLKTSNEHHHSCTLGEKVFTGILWEVGLAERSNEEGLNLKDLCFLFKRLCLLCL